MKTFTRRTCIGKAGVLRLAFPTDIINSEVDVIVVTQPVSSAAVTDNGYPADFFEQIDGIEADDLLD